MSARRIDLTGRRFGRLVVAAAIGETRYGGRPQALWRCLCDCGGAINLPSDKLPHSQSAIKATRRAGRYPYESCEACRTKPCALCGQPFPVSDSARCCPSCRPVNDKLREQHWHAEAKQRYRTDPEFRRRARQAGDRWYAKNAADVQAQRKRKFESLPAEQKNQRVEKKRESIRLYAMERRRREALASMLSVGADLVQKTETPND